ncbi:MAG: serine/threonine protein kinase [Chloroflexota bacterium]|nr:serine/threonine protein kinase [Chloroflexota bacterium]MDQ5865186.1 serine/threonine protein kinase [Chloroflexota bacterium]
MLICPLCGKYNSDDKRNCEACGAFLGQAERVPASPPPSGSMSANGSSASSEALSGPLCPVCRRPNRATSAFCAHCGQRLRTGSGDPSYAMPHVAAPVYTPGGPPTSPPVSVAPDVTGNIPAGTVLKRRYRILRKVAQGGMGAVYESTDTQSPIGNRAAIKEISPAALPPGERTQAVADFRREAQMLARLQHDNLVKVVETFEELGKHFLVMEFVPGRTLLNVLDLAGGPLPEQRVMVWARQIIDVIQYLHTQDPPIIYRDLKPANVMLVEGTVERIKLIDFGIARLHKAGKTSDTEAFGTAGYAPPEQYGKGQTDQRSDIYAFAATMHHLLTNRDPSLNPFNWLSIRRYNPGVSTRVDTAIMQALNLDPQKRFQSVEAFAQALGLDGAYAPRSRPLREPVAAAPAPSPAPSGSKANRQSKKPQPTPVAPALEPSPVRSVPATPTYARPAVADLPIAASVAAPAVSAAPAFPSAPANPFPDRTGGNGKVVEVEPPIVTAPPPTPDIVAPTTATALPAKETTVQAPVESAPAPAPAQPKAPPSDVRVPGRHGSAGAPALVVSDRLVDLGEAKWNRRTVKHVQLGGVGGAPVEGRVSASHPWIAYNPAQFKGNTTLLEVKVRRGQLRFGRVQLQVPNLFAMIWTRTRRWLPFLGFWFWLLLLVASSLGRTLLWATAGAVVLLLVAEALLLLWSWHVKMLVPAEHLNTGRLLVKSSGGDQQIEVRVMARPSGVRKALGWTMALVLLTAELAGLAWLVINVVLQPLNIFIPPF